MGEYDCLHAAVKAAQKGDDLFRTARLAHAGKANNIGEQHRYILPPDRAQGRVGGGELIDHIGREIARKIGPLAFGRGLRLDQPPRAPDHHRHDAGEDGVNDDLLHPAHDEHEILVEEYPPCFFGRTGRGGIHESDSFGQ